MSDEFRPARMAAIEPAAQDQMILSLEHDAVLEAGHTRPGQYCQVTLEGVTDKSFFVLIDPPRAGPARFLLRGGAGTVVDALLTRAPGAALALRGPLGRGFDVEAARGRDVILVSAGSGLGAIRPLLLSIVPYTARRVWLYHGARTLVHVPFRDDLAQAERHGVRVSVVLSRGADGTAASGRGRVQDAIARDRPDLSDAVAFIAGMDEMVQSLRTILPSLGLPLERIHMNY